MAFLDNSGDIILDAVLTDVGRKRMAQGDFKISKFAIGDDEIDYQLYNKNHPSGSAYYDLEILQTPVLEAFTQTNASINYGLTTFANQNLFYLPSIALNDKSIGGSNAFIASTGVIYLSINNTTPAGKTTRELLKEDFSSGDNIALVQGTSLSPFILIETGIDTTAVKGTAAKQSELIISNGLLDNNFDVSFDNRFISQVGFSTNTGFRTVESGGGFVPQDISFKNGSEDNTLENYSTVTVEGFITQIYSPSTGDDNTANISAIRGPRGSHCALNFTVNDSLTEQTYLEFGSVNRTQNGGSQLYDFIDTNVYVRGASTGTTITLPIRIITNS
tara:strand:+ start:11964 stop:12959 length:996 start_codon:yes stop_codon:yes gene_type:complete